MCTNKREKNTDSYCKTNLLHPKETKSHPEPQNSWNSRFIVGCVLKNFTHANVKLKKQTNKKSLEKKTALRLMLKLCFVTETFTEVQIKPIMYGSPSIVLPSTLFSPLHCLDFKIFSIWWAKFNSGDSCDLQHRTTWPTYPLTLAWPWSLFLNV